MKRIFCILLALLMILSTASYAAPSAVGCMDSAAEMPKYSIDTASNDETAELSAVIDGVDKSVYGTPIYSITFDGTAAVGTAYSNNNNFFYLSDKHAALGITKVDSYFTGSYNAMLNLNGTIKADAAKGSNVYEGTLPFPTTSQMLGVFFDTVANSKHTMPAGIYTLVYDAKLNETAGVFSTSNKYASNVAWLGKIHEDNELALVNDNTWHTHAKSIVAENTIDGSAGTNTFFRLYNAQNSVRAKSGAAGTLSLDNIAVYYKPLAATVTAMNGEAVAFTAPNVPTTGVLVSDIVAGHSVSGYSITGIIYNGAEYELTDTVVINGDVTVELILEELEIPENISYGTEFYSWNLDSVTSITAHTNTASSNGAVFTSETANVTRMYFRPSTANYTVVAEGDGKYIQAPVTGYTDDGDYPMSFDALIDWAKGGTAATGGIYTFVFDAKLDATASYGTGHNCVRFMTPSGLMKNYDLKLTADGAWHTYAVTGDLTDLSESALNGVFLYQHFDSKATGNIAFDNIKMYKKPAKATVSYMLPDGNISSITKQNVSTTGVTAAELLEGLNFRGYNEPTAVEYAGVTYNVGDTTPIVFAQSEEIVKVIATARDVSVYAPETIMSADVRAILGGANNGMRFRATMATAGDTVEEAGWIVTRGEFLTAAGLTGEGFYRDSDVTKIEGLNIDTNGTNKIFASENNIDSFAAVLINIPEANYDDIMYARPFVVDQDGTWYGDTISGSYRQAAKFVRDNATGLDANTIAALNEVINA